MFASPVLTTAMLNSSALVPKPDSAVFRCSGSDYPLELRSRFRTLGIFYSSVVNGVIPVGNISLFQAGWIFLWSCSSPSTDYAITLTWPWWWCRRLKYESTVRWDECKSKVQPPAMARTVPSIQSLWACGKSEHFEEEELTPLETEVSKSRGEAPSAHISPSAHFHFWLHILCSWPPSPPSHPAAACSEEPESSEEGVEIIFLCTWRPE